jgi:hypothetical protein
MIVQTVLSAIVICCLIDIYVYFDIYVAFTAILLFLLLLNLPLLQFWFEEILLFSKITKRA